MVDESLCLSSGGQDSALLTGLEFLCLNTKLLDSSLSVMAMVAAESLTQLSRAACLVVCFICQKNALLATPLVAYEVFFPIHRGRSSLAHCPSPPGEETTAREVLGASSTAPGRVFSLKVRKIWEEGG